MVKGENRGKWRKNGENEIILHSDKESILYNVSEGVLLRKQKHNGKTKGRTKGNCGKIWEKREGKGKGKMRGFFST